MSAPAPIPFIDLRPGADAAAVREAIDRVVARGWFVLGPEVDAFETEFAAASSAAFAVGVGNGTDAIALALRALGIGDGDEVIVPAMTAAYTALAVIAVRFLYGVRIAGPVMIGASPLPWSRYLLLNACGALLWAACWLGAGYVLGAAAERLLGNLARVERELFIVVLIVGVALAFFVRRRARSARKSG